MSITLHVDPETERLARRLAEATNTTVPALVRSAIEAKAENLGIALSDLGRERPYNDELELDYYDDGPAQ